MAFWRFHIPPLLVYFWSYQNRLGVSVGEYNNRSKRANLGVSQGYTSRKLYQSHSDATSTMRLKNASIVK
jgi:hypothetical protein